METIKKQTKRYTKYFTDAAGVKYRIVAKLRHDDSCGNGYETTGITADISRKHSGKWKLERCGVLHAEISEHFPELRGLLKWHLCSTAGPMHYIPNALYWAGHHKEWCRGGPNDPPNADHFRAVVAFGSVPGDEETDWKSMTREELVAWLEQRRAKLLAEHRRAIEGAGLRYTL